MIERPFGHPRRVDGSGGQLAGDTERRRHHLVGRDGLRHEADPFGFSAVEEVGGQQVVLRLRHAAQQRPDRNGVVAAGDAEANVAVGELGRLVDHADVGHQCDGQAGTDGHAVDRRDDRRVAVDHRADDVAGFLHHPHRLRVVADLFGDPVEVAAGGERAPGAGDDHGPHLVVVADVAEHAGQLQMHRRIGRVHLVGVVERDPQDPAGTIVGPVEAESVVRGVAVAGHVTRHYARAS